MSSTHHGVLLHVVFSTKYRKPFLDAKWRPELYAVIGGIVKEHKAALLNAGGIEDHVHLLLKIHPSSAIADTVKLAKANSSRWINEQRMLTLRFEWQRGYGAFSVSQSMRQRVGEYIRNQEQHHRKQSFKEEYFTLLRNHQVDFDERYVFDDEITG